LSVTDSEGNNWYETPYLAQDTLFYDTPNTDTNTRDEVPYLIRLRTVPRRFITRVNEDEKIEMQFGAGVSTSPDEYIIPNPTNVGIGLAGVSTLDASLDPSNFMYTKTYGQCPYSTTLTVNYTYGGGIKSNTSKGSLTKLRNVS